MGSSRILEKYIYFLKIQKSPRKSEYHLQHQFFVRAVFLHSKRPVVRSLLSNPTRSCFLFLFYCLLRILIGNWYCKQMSRLIDNVFTLAIGENSHPAFKVCSYHCSMKLSPFNHISQCHFLKHWLVIFYVYTYPQNPIKLHCSFHLFLTRFLFIRKKFIRKWGSNRQNLKKMVRKSRGSMSKIKCFYRPKIGISSLLHSKC